MSNELLVSGARRSWSQLKSWTTCGEQYRLERIASVPQAPAWWFVGGSAFHTATEWLDKGIEDDPKHAWFKAWNEELERTTAGTDVPQGEWRAGGRPTKEKPRGETGSWWMTAGVAMVEQYVAWRDGCGWQIADFGVPAIEMEVSASFGIVPIKGFIDRVFALPTGELCVVDLKTGSRTPPGAQNGLYATLMEKTIGIRPTFGAYYMARKGTVSPPEQLDRFSVPYWDRVLPDFDRAVANRIFLPHVSPMCGSCSVNKYCAAFGGELAHLAPLDLEGM